jgi:hypothetical protein
VHLDGLFLRLVDTVKSSALILILAAGAVPAYFIHVSALTDRRTEGEGAALVALPAFRPVAAPVAAAPDENSIPLDNPVALIRELQRELKRVGCYDGRTNGTWTAETRRAMKDFTGRANAMLPVEKPDPVLLALVKSHEAGMCDADPAPDPARQLQDASPRQEQTVTGALPAVAPQPSAPLETQEARAPETSAVSAPEESTQGEAAAVAADAPVEPAAAQPDGFAPAAIHGERRARRSGQSKSPADDLSRSVTKGFKNLERALNSIFN